MEPLKPEIVRQAYRVAAPAAAGGLKEDIEEYERLLAERFTTDPDLPTSPRRAHAVSQAEDRIEQLHAKIFGTPRAQSSGDAPADP